MEDLAQLVKPGDVLLFPYVPLEPHEHEVSELLREALIAADILLHFKVWPQSKIDEKSAEIEQLILFFIAAADGDAYMHSAIVSENTEGDLVVFEINQTGFHTTALAEYEPEAPKVIRRYQNDGHTLGSPQLPFEPVLTKIREWQGKKEDYGYYNGLMMIGWCLMRDYHEDLVGGLKTILKRVLGDSVCDAIFAALPNDEIRRLLQELCRLALERLQKPGQLVCSQLVASCFVEANPEYPIRLDDTGREPPQPGPWTSWKLGETDQGYLEKIRVKIVDAAGEVQDGSPVKADPALMFSLRDLDMSPNFVVVPSN
jgi:hypothetical protein